MQVAISQLQQRQQVADAQFFADGYDNNKYILELKAQYAQQMGTVKRQLETGDIAELLILPGDLMSVLARLKDIEDMASHALEDNLRYDRQFLSEQERNSRDRRRKSRDMDFSDWDSGGSSSWSSGSSSSSRGSSRRSSSRSSSRRSSSRGSSRRSSSRGSSRRR